MPISKVALALLLAVSLAWPALASELDTTDEHVVRKALSDKEARVRLAAANAAKSLQSPKLTSPLLRCLKDDVTEVRLAAAEALRLREGKKERKAAARGMASQLRDLPREPSSDQIDREAILVPVLHDLAQPISIKTLLDIHTEAPNDLIKARLFAVANVPAPDAIESLINYAAKRRGGDGHRNLAHQALQYATGERFGRDPDRWRAWWREAKDTFDFEAHADRRAEQRDKAERKAEAKEEREQKRREKRKKREKKDEQGHGSA